MDITSKENRLVKDIRRLMTQARFRRESGRFAVEGARLCHDAALSDVTVEAVLATAKAVEKYADYLELFTERNVPMHTVTEALSAYMADTATPQGVFCLCRRAKKKETALSLKGRYLALESVQDPANLGAILRTAEAMGVSGVLLSGGCCDPYNPKVLRASMGGVFRLPLYECGAMSEMIVKLREQGFACYASVVSAGARSVLDVSFTDGCVCFVGNEGNGLTPATTEACDERITIPMIGRAESLNASMAAGILLWEMMKTAEVK